MYRTPHFIVGDIPHMAKQATWDVCARGGAGDLEMAS